MNFHPHLGGLQSYEADSLYEESDGPIVVTNQSTEQLNFTLKKLSLSASTSPKVALLEDFFKKPVLVDSVDSNHSAKRKSSDDEELFVPSLRFRLNLKSSDEEEVPEPNWNSTQLLGSSDEKGIPEPSWKPRSVVEQTVHQIANQTTGLSCLFLQEDDKQFPNPSEFYTRRMQALDIIDKPAISFMEKLLQFPEAMSFYAKPKNRYLDVLPKSKGLVKLLHRSDENSDYINANQFENMIITQGPLATTLADFWIMVFEQADHIVCLTDFIDSGIEKTYPYWNPHLMNSSTKEKQQSEGVILFDQTVGPSGKSFQVLVKLVEAPVIEIPSCTVPEFVTKRTLEISLDGKVKIVTHWHYEKWQDQSICDAKKLAQMFEIMLKYPGILAIHCSAGIGRSGVFAIVKKFICQYINQGTIPTEIDIDRAIIELRSHRPRSVQTAQQRELISTTIYTFIQNHKK